jgi:dipeptidyl aminopeptidase/acylaminoacyl peptidase
VYDILPGHPAPAALRRPVARLCALVAVVVTCAVVAWRPGLTASAQTATLAAATFTVEQVLDYPFPSNLVASPTGAAIAWTFAERGARNLYVAEGPAFAARRVTPYLDDDGQEITSVSFTRDGRTLVYVRGGDHGANWPAEGNLQPDPNSSPVQPKMQVWSVPAAGGAPPRLIGEGDEAAVSPDGSRVAFVSNKRIWIGPIDGSKAAEQAFFARGSSGSPRWSPDGRQLAFVSDRDDHSFIGIFRDAATPLRYLSPSTSRDVDPAWSPDGRTLAFIRMPGRGGTPKSALVQQPRPWAIWIVPADGSQPAREAWKSGAALVDSVPSTADDRNLRWGADGRLTFLSYHDGWPHLYALQTNPRNAPRLLTPGEFMVEHVAISPDGRTLVYSANSGAERNDIDRRHIFKVAIDGSSPPAPVTHGAGLEWSPVVTGDGQTVAMLASDAQRSPLPVVTSMAGGPMRAIGADRVPREFPASRLVTPEPIVFKSSDGVEVHGQLFRTPGSGKRPGLVYVHGGPPRQMLLGWHYMDYYANDYGANQYLASRGFVVLSVNYRLGIGYGHGFQYPERAGARGASEYLDVLAAGRYLQARPDVDAARVGIWGGSYGGFLTALALGRNSDVFAAGVDIHGVHDRLATAGNLEMLARAMAGDGISEADYRQTLKVAYESSPISAVPTWKSPVLLIHGDDDRNVQFHQTVDLKRRLMERGVTVEELVIPDDIHDFLMWRSWRTVATAAGDFLERRLLRRSPETQR